MGNESEIWGIFGENLYYQGGELVERKGMRIWEIGREWEL